MMLQGDPAQYTTTSIFTIESNLKTTNGFEFDVCEFFGTHGTWAAYTASALCILGIISNAILLYTVYRSVVLRGASSNTLTASVGFGNVLLLLLSAPAYIKIEFDFCWALGVSACKFYAFSEVFTISGISFSMLAINSERFFRAITGAKEYDSHVRYILVICIWAAAFAFAIPTAGFADLAFDHFCQVRPYYEPQGRSYILCQFLFVYLFPSILHIMVHLWVLVIKREKDSDPEVPHHTPKQYNIATAIMTLTMIVAWLPFYIFDLGVEFQSLPFENRNLMMNLYDSQYILLYFNATLCPFILWAFSGMHREAMLEEVCCGGQCFVRCGRRTGDRYASFRNEFDLDADATEMPAVTNGDLNQV